MIRVENREGGTISNHNHKCHDKNRETRNFREIFYCTKKVTNCFLKYKKIARLEIMLVFFK